MRWLALIALSGCVPISASEYTGGKKDELDGSLANAEAREDARTPSIDAAQSPDARADDAAASMDVGEDARVLPPLTQDAGGGEAPDAGQPTSDAGNVEQDAAVVDAGKEDASPDAMSEPPVITCATVGVLCDDFETGPSCPTVPGPNWAVCEQISDETGPKREALAGAGGYALRSVVSEAPVERAQRVIRGVPLDIDYFEVQFWMITDPTDNPRFVWMKLQQEVGMDAKGEPINYPGVSLLGVNGKIVAAVETQQKLSPAPDSFYQEAELAAWPAGWHRFRVQIDFKTPSVRFEYGDEQGNSTPWELSGFPFHKVPVIRQYLAIGLYADNPGKVQMLFDDLHAYATKNGKVVPLP
jgi:hypothetical protein